MPGSLIPSDSRRAAPSRTLIICAAAILGLAIGSLPRLPAASAQEARPPAAPTVPPAPAVAPPPEAPSTQAPSTPAPQGDAAAAKTHADAGSGKRTVTITKGDKTITVTGAGDESELDSFDEMVRTRPEFFGMVIAVVAVIFFAPVLAIALILGYRMRKTRMQNETLLKLAERGVVSAPEAMSALTTGAAPLSASMPVADAVREVRKRAAWSDLRKGVVMTAMGLAISVYSTVEHDHPNVFGLILLFLGIGYGVLWWFEQRQIASAPAPSAGSADRGGGG